MRLLYQRDQTIGIAAAEVQFLTNNFWRKRKMSNKSSHLICATALFFLMFQSHLSAAEQHTPKSASQLAWEEVVENSKKNPIPKEPVEEVNDENAIRIVFEKNAALGKVLRIVDLPNWFNGTRKRVLSTDGADYLFYFFKNHDVASITRKKDDEEKEIYRNNEPKKFTGIRPSTGDFPKYSVLDNVSGIGDIMISTFSKKTSADLMEKVMIHVAEKEGFKIGYLYCSKVAFEANYDSGYADRNPGALEKCRLGRYEKGHFEKDR
jgi:hypothetical protein